MEKIGKILLFNGSDGKGFLLTPEREKINFSIENWHDFDIMPSLGLEVSFMFEDGEAINIISNSHPTATESSINIEILNEKIIKIKEKKIDIEVSLDDALEKRLQVNSKTEDKTLSQNEEKPFESEYTNDVIEDINKEIGPKPKNIHIDTNLETAVEKYFATITGHINRRIGYKKVKGRLDYVVAKRFIWTIYNNLTEMDMSVLTPRVKALSDDLRIMGSVYEDFNTKVKYPPIAFEEVFLSCQMEYKNIREQTEKVKDNLILLRNNEKLIGGMLGIKKAELKKDESSDVLQHEFKSLNGSYADVVHMMAELDERYKHTLILLYNFEEAYRKKFYTIFQEKAEKYKDDLIEILNAQAYIVDEQLWKEAKQSKPINSYFKTSAIVGDLNIKTYLKYYLNSLGSNKDSQENQKLFKLYDYLMATQKEYALVVTESTQDAVEHEISINGLGKAYNAKSFVDEKNAIKWAKENCVKVLIIEDQLKNTSAETFLRVYHNNILNKPKIILLGNRPQTSSNEYNISKLLSKNISSKVLADNIKLMFDN